MKAEFIIHSAFNIQHSALFFFAHVGHTSMPAGLYTLAPVENDDSLMQLSDGHHAVVFVMTERDYPKVAPRQDEVTFAKQGDTYTLRELGRTRSWQLVAGSW